MSPVRSFLATRWDVFLARMERAEAKRARMLPGWRTRRRRRSLVLLMLVGIAPMLVAAAIMAEETIWIFFALWFTGFILWMIGFALLRILTGKMSSAFSVLLDEREREMRHRVTHLSFQVLVYLMAFAMLYTLAIANQADAAFRGALMMAVLLMLGSSGPTIVLGWTLPDDDPSDFSEEGNSVA
ncbi:hypothetical protein [Amycolatopsis anabasis]|uniref:hypothetical protein n=1 Tax=Amycolatopsis anabasis TaxID=1840409 RepID=UPI00131A942F|nr:hypothetical protein [Amycolatopsis anabasis]